MTDTTQWCGCCQDHTEHAAYECVPCAKEAAECAALRARVAELERLCEKLVKDAPHTTYDELMRGRVSISWTNNAAHVEEIREALGHNDGR